MTSTTTTARRLFLLCFAAALLAALGCSSGGGVATTTPQLICNDDGAAPANAVTMNCGAVEAGVTERVDVVMGGPATGSTTLSGFNFDVLYDPSKLEFVSVTGETSELFPSSALVLGALQNRQPGRVVVSIHQAGGVPDVAVFPGLHVVLSISFRLVAGATFGPTPVGFDPSASEASGASTTISFNSDLTLAHQ